MKSPSERLGRFLSAHGLSASGAACLLGVTHAAVLKWLDGEVPSEPFRDAIETFTAEWPEGPIRAADWGPTEREQGIAKKLANVRPLPPPPSPDDTPAKASA